MSSRQEEKERRRREREEAERAAAASSSRRKRLGIVLGGVVAAAVALIVVLAVASGDETSPEVRGVLPPARETNEAEAARAAGCELQTHRSEGRGHTSETVQYKTNPPTSGSHDPTPAQEGIYPADGPPDLEQSVHALEHGRVLIQYKAGLPQREVDRLRTLAETFEVKGTAGYHGLFFQNQTNMPAQVAATAWTKSLTCPRMNDRVFDAIRTFWRTNVDKAPEFIP